MPSPGRLICAIGTIALVLPALQGCGALPSRAADPGMPTSGLPCAAQTTGLLGGTDMPSGMTLWSESSSSKLGLFTMGDSPSNPYSHFLGRTVGTFLWTGLYGGTPLSLAGQRWAELHATSKVPIGYIPDEGALFTAYPRQVFRASESTVVFGTSDEAVLWMNSQHINSPHSDPGPANGVVTNPQVPRIGDDTFAFQVSNGSSGDLVTAVDVRVGSVTLGITLDSGPQLDALPIVLSLIHKLVAREQSTCSIGD